MSETLLCPDSIPSFLNFFDLSIAPQLLFYTYLPAILISIFLAFYVFKNDNKSLASKIFVGICTFFTLWVLNIFILWIGAYNSTIMFGWQISPVFEVPIFILSVYFILVMTDKEKKDISSLIKLIFLAIMAIVFLVLPTHFNMVYYTISDCEAIPGIFSYITYACEILSTIIVFGICVKRYLALPKGDVFKKEIIYLGFGLISFMLLFTSSDLIGQITGIQEISFFGSLGMVIFLAFLVYLITKFRIFNIKLLGAQVLVWALVILVGSQFFYLTDSSLIVKILTSVTLVISSILGLILVRSVKKEIALVEKLEVANVGQKNLIHIMNHQIKGYLSIDKNIFAELLTDDYGKVPDEAKDIIKKGLDSADKGAKYVSDVLRGDSAENGTLTYDMKPMDFKNLVSEVIAKEKDNAEKKGLKFISSIDNGNYNMIGDISYLGETVRNLIDNSIYYTPSGSISINLSVKNNKILFKIVDTGVGIKEEDKSKLFKAGGVGSESIKVNTNSSGYGLAFVKGVIESHKGKVWFESAGYGKGSTFFVELPLK